MWKVEKKFITSSIYFVILSRETFLKIIILGIFTKRNEKLVINTFYPPLARNEKYHEITIERDFPFSGLLALIPFRDFWKRSVPFPCTTLTYIPFHLLPFREYGEFKKKRKKKEEKKYPTPIRKSLTGCNFTKLARRGHCWERGVHCHAFFVPSSLFTRAVSAVTRVHGCVARKE